jgi:hypothetical protein
VAGHSSREVLRHTADARLTRHQVGEVYEKTTQPIMAEIPFDGPG